MNLFYRMKCLKLIGSLISFSSIQGLSIIKDGSSFSPAGPANVFDSFSSGFRERRWFFFLRTANVFDASLADSRNVFHISSSVNSVNVFDSSSLSPRNVFDFCLE